MKARVKDETCILSKEEQIRFFSALQQSDIFIHFAPMKGLDENEKLEWSVVEVADVEGSTRIVIHIYFMGVFIKSAILLINKEGTSCDWQHLNS